MFAVTLAMASLCLSAEKPEDLRARAETAFAEGVEGADTAPREARERFRLAARCYEQLRQDGMANPDLYLSQGNAWFLGGDLPHAILAYRRGLILQPSNFALQAALANARTEVKHPGGVGQPAIEHRPPWLPRWPGVLLVLVFIGYSAACLCGARWWMLRQRRLLGTAALALTAALAAGAGLLAETASLQNDLAHPLVVITVDDVQLRKGNGETYPARVETPLNRGVEAIKLAELSGWLQIELGTGEVGWVQKSFCLVDED